MDHAARMALAQEVTHFVRARHPDTIAVGVHGSTAKGEDRVWSDLEMIGVTRGETDVRAYGGVFRGIVVEIGLMSAEEALREAGRVTASWPVEADGWIHYLPTYDPEGLLARLAASAANPSADALALAARGALLGMYEDLCKMRNFLAAGEGAMVRFMAPNFALWGPARVVALLNRDYYNGVRNVLTKPFEFSKLPPHFGEDYPRLAAAAGTPRALLRRAERMFRECRVLTRDAGIDWREDAPLEEALARGRVPR